MAQETTNLQQGAHSKQAAQYVLIHYLTTPFLSKDKVTTAFTIISTFLLSNNNKKKASTNTRQKSNPPVGKSQCPIQEDRLIQNHSCI